MGNCICRKKENDYSTLYHDAIMNSNHYERISIGLHNWQNDFMNRYTQQKISRLRFMPDDDIILSPQMQLIYDSFEFNETNEFSYELAMILYACEKHKNKEKMITFDREWTYRHLDIIVYKVPFYQSISYL